MIFKLKIYFTKAIPKRIRAQLIDDAFALSTSGELSIVKPFEILRYLEKESEYLPWSTAITNLRHLTFLLDSTATFGNFRGFVLELVTPLYNKLGWVEKNTESWPDK